MKIFIKQLFCNHIWKLELIHSKKSRRIYTKSCIKCHKSKILFAGNKKRWNKYLENDPEFFIS